MIQFKRRASAAIVSLVVALLLSHPVSPQQQAGGQAPALASHQQLLRDIYKELIEINTTDSAVKSPSRIRSLLITDWYQTSPRDRPSCRNEKEGKKE
ncbi:MAG: hypothetical protein H0W38_14095 [Methylibium sp.]|nr:hypothetical protein [Methylibium sp.]